MAAFFTADTHFGDPDILRRRIWAASAPEHDEQLITGWNDRVGPMDGVWHLGDFAAGASRMRCAEIFARLNGTKRLIRGSHDSNRVLNLPWAEAPLESACISVRDFCGAEHGLHLAHYAHRSWPGLWRGVRHLYGHTHATLPDTRRFCDVAVDAWHYRPVPLDAIIARQDGATEWPEKLARAPRQAGPLS